MDPVSRRFVWKHIDSIKEGRVVLLVRSHMIPGVFVSIFLTCNLFCLALYVHKTTHAMEEADLLADTVVIMRKGDVAASGSPLQLKTEHGSSLQFTLLVEPEDLDRTVGLIHQRFAGQEEWVDVQQGGTGNVTVAITKVRDESIGLKPGDVSDDGVDVETLVQFAAFLDSSDSGVREYGFSNSSLEEVFLKVTRGENEEETQTMRTSNGDSPDPEQSLEDEQNDALAVTIDENAMNGIGSFQPKLTVKRQLKAFLKFMIIRDWVGKSSLSNWLTLGVFLFLSVIIAINSTHYLEFGGVLILIVFTLFLPLLTIMTPIYHERYSGLFYLTRAQGMLKTAHISAQAVYSYCVSLLFTFLVLSFVFATPLFRMSEVCDPVDGDQCKWKFGDRHKMEEVPLVEWWSDEYEGQSVQLYARHTPGHYGLMVGIMAALPLTIPGSVLASSHLPGFKIGITLLALIVLIVTIIPWVLSELFSSRKPNRLQECEWDICNTTFYGNESTVDGETFLNCVGLDTHTGPSGAFCIPTVAGLLPQMGTYQGLYMSLISEITLTSDPPRVR